MAKTVKKWGYHVLIAIDQLFNALTGGGADETLSSRTYRRAVLTQSKPKKRWRVLYRVINGLFRDPHHCEGVQDVVVIMVTSSNIEQFIADLETVRELLPEPTFKQALDYAKSSKDLQTTKMVKTPTMANPSFSNGADITPGSARTMQSILRNATAAAVAVQTQDPMVIIKALKEAKALRDKQNQEQADKLLESNSFVYSFVGADFLAVIEPQIKQGVPMSENIFTAAVMFIGNDLTNIRAMLSDE